MRLANDWRRALLAVCLATATALLVTPRRLDAQDASDTGDKPTSGDRRLPDVEETGAEFLEICEQLRSGHHLYFGTAQVAHIRSVLDEPDLPPLSQVKGMGQLGRHLVRLDRTDEAVEVFRQAIEISRAHDIPESLELALLAELGLAHLRIAETTNCIRLHGPAMCIYPIGPGGRHPDPEAARKAYKIFQEFIARDPTSATVRWLLVLSTMVLGEYPQALQPDFRVPEQRLASGALARFSDVAGKTRLGIVDNAGGAVVEDIDGDGLLDIVTSSVEPCTPLRYRRNDGRGGFVDLAREAGLTGQLGGNNLVHADYDNDGDPDLLVLRGGWFGASGKIRNSLLRNDNGHFVDVTRAVGLADPAYPTQTAAWADFDLDGDLDLYIGNEGVHPQLEIYPSQLFRNDGAGADGMVTFTEVAAATGVTNDRYAKGVTWGDYDNDGDPDLYVSNLGPNRLYRNNGVDAKGQVSFTDVASELGLVEPARRSFPTWFFDFDNDGWLDIFVADYRATTEEISSYLLGKEVPDRHPLLYRNLGAAGSGVAFREMSEELGLTAPSVPMGANYGDLDNDGFLDLYLGTGFPDYQALMPNLMYRNDAGRRFVDVTHAGGFGHLQKGHGIAFADIDNDGDQDVFEQMGGAYPGDVYPSTLYENPGNDNNWITLRLVGTTSNRSAIGARITIEVASERGISKIHRRVGTGGSFGSSPLRQEIGLGTSDEIRRIEVSWPASGLTQEFRDVVPNRAYELTEGRDELVVIPLQKIVLGVSRPIDHLHQKP